MHLCEVNGFYAYRSIWEGGRDRGEKRQAGVEEQGRKEEKEEEEGEEEEGEDLFSVCTTKMAFGLLKDSSFTAYINLKNKQR